MKTAFFRRRTSRSYQAAETIGLLRMMRSESFVLFAESLTGLKLNRDRGIQVSCYEHGDYAGPHNDHHPESEFLKDGFVDFHVMFFAAIPPAFKEMLIVSYYSSKRLDAVEIDSQKAIIWCMMIDEVEQN